MLLKLFERTKSRFEVIEIVSYGRSTTLDDNEIHSRTSPDTIQSIDTIQKQDIEWTMN